MVQLCPSPSSLPSSQVVHNKRKARFLLPHIYGIAFVILDSPSHPHTLLIHPYHVTLERKYRMVTSRSACCLFSWPPTGCAMGHKPRKSQDPPSRNSGLFFPVMLLLYYCCYFCCYTSSATASSARPGNGNALEYTRPSDHHQRSRNMKRVGPDLT